MKTEEYEALKTAIMGPEFDGEAIFRWELLKALWAIERALRIGE